MNKHIKFSIFTNLDTEYANNTPMLLAYKSLSSKALLGIKWWRVQNNGG